MMPEKVVKNTAPDAPLAKLPKWLASALVILLNLVAEIGYQLQSDTCRNEMEWCLIGLSDGLLVYIVLFALVAIWHFSDLVPLRSQRRPLQAVASYTPFSISLVALVGSFWVFRASTTVGDHGYYEQPLPIVIVTFGLIIFVPLLVLAKAGFGLYDAIEAGIEIFHGRRSLSKD